MDEADWLIHDVRAAIGELEKEIIRGDADAEQVRDIAEGQR